MSEWDERIREHRVWDELNQLGPNIDIALNLEDSPPDAAVGLERLKTVLAYSGKRIAASDPLLSVPSSLDAVANNLAAIQNELVAFQTDRNLGHIVSANLNADGALISLAQLPGLYSPEELGILVQSTTAHRRTVTKALKEAEKKLLAFEARSNEGLAGLDTALNEVKSRFQANAEGLDASLKAVSASIETQKQRLATIATEQQGQFSTAQDARSKDFTESVRLANETFNKLATEYQGQFSAAQDVRGKENTAAESARQTKFNETLAGFTKKLTEQDAEFTKERTTFVGSSEEQLKKLSQGYQDTAALVLTDIEAKRKRVEELVGVIGNLGVTSGYLRTANQARKAMWGWQGLTVAALGTLSFLAYRTLGVLENNGHFNWGNFAARALLLVSLGVIAAYSGTQADKLFTDERRNRKLALELEAIGPYLEPLPIEEQNKFRVDIGNRSFGRDHDPHEHRKSPASVLDLVKTKEGKEVLELLLELGKKAKDLT
ncbi:MAG: hypothetical protein WBY53_01125 [Acidobacteriaceae bacterium]